MTKQQVLQALDELYEQQHRKSYLVACLFLEPEDLAAIEDELVAHDLPEGSVGRLDNVAVYEVNQMAHEATLLDPLKIDCYRGIHYAYLRALVN